MPLPAPNTRMTADEFLLWAMQQPEGERYELANGEVIAMAPERLSHARAKLHVVNQLDAAITAAGLDCEAITDGMTVAVDATTLYEPDAMVRCGASLEGEVTRITDPVIVVEVLSPSTRGRDTSAKLVDYFRLPSVRHYLILRTTDRVIVHHARGEDGVILTRILRDGPIVLDPPGITLTEPFSPRV